MGFLAHGNSIVNSSLFICNPPYARKVPFIGHWSASLPGDHFSPMVSAAPNPLLQEPLMSERQLGSQGLSGGACPTLHQAELPSGEGLEAGQVSVGIGVCIITGSSFT